MAVQGISSIFHHLSLCCSHLCIGCMPMGWLLCSLHNVIIAIHIKEEPHPAVHAASDTYMTWAFENTHIIYLCLNSMRRIITSGPWHGMQKRGEDRGSWYRRPWPSTFSQLEKNTVHDVHGSLTEFSYGVHTEKSYPLLFFEPVHGKVEGPALCPWALQRRSRQRRSCRVPCGTGNVSCSAPRSFALWQMTSRSGASSLSSPLCLDDFHPYISLYISIYFLIFILYFP